MSDNETTTVRQKAKPKQGARPQKPHSGLVMIKERPAVSDLIELGRTANQISQSTAFLVAMHTMQERLMLGLLEASDAEVERLRAQHRNFQMFQDELSEMINRAESLSQSMMTEQEKTIAKRAVEYRVAEEWNQ